MVWVKQGDGPFTYTTPETMLREDDVLVVAGEPRKAEEFASLGQPMGEGCCDRTA